MGTDRENGDYYRYSPTQYLHYYAALRRWTNSEIAIELDLGYAQNIGGIDLHHIDGVDTHVVGARRSLNGGLMVGISLYFFPELGKGK